MTIEDWAVAYMLRFGNGTHSGYAPGEQDFLDLARADLKTDTPYGDIYWWIKSHTGDKA